MLSILFCVALLAGNYSRPVVQTQQRQPPAFTVPYTAAKVGTPQITVNVNGQINVDMMLDTGTNISAIAEDVAKSLPFTPQPAVSDSGKPINFNGKQARMLQGPFVDISNQLRLTGIWIILPAEQLDIFSGKTSTQGILGADVVQVSAIRINPVRKQLTFWPLGKLSAEELKSLGFENAVVLPFKLNARNRMVTSVKLNDSQEIELPVDTGAARTTLPLNTVKKLKLPVHQRGVSISTAIGEIKTDEYRLETFSLGSLKVHDLIVNASRNDSHATFFPKLGLDVLQRYDIIMDFPGGKLYLKPLEADSPIHKETKPGQP